MSQQFFNTTGTNNYAEQYRTSAQANTWNVQYPQTQFVQSTNQPQQNIPQQFQCSPQNYQPHMVYPSANTQTSNNQAYQTNQQAIYAHQNQFQIIKEVPQSQSYVTTQTNQHYLTQGYIHPQSLSTGAPQAQYPQPQQQGLKKKYINSNYQLAGPQPPYPQALQQPMQSFNPNIFVNSYNNHCDQNTSTINNSSQTPALQVGVAGLYNNLSQHTQHLNSSPEVMSSQFNQILAHHPASNLQSLHENTVDKSTLNFPAQLSGSSYVPQLQPNLNINTHIQQQVPQNSSLVPNQPSYYLSSALEFTGKLASQFANDLGSITTEDDFGEFAAAENPPPAIQPTSNGHSANVAEDDFGEFAASENPPPAIQPTSNGHSENVAEDDFGEFSAAKNPPPAIQATSNIHTGYVAEDDFGDFSFAENNTAAASQGMPTFKAGNCPEEVDLLKSKGTSHGSIQSDQNSCIPQELAAANLFLKQMEASSHSLNSLLSADSTSEQLENTNLAINSLSVNSTSSLLGAGEAWSDFKGESPQPKSIMMKDSEKRENKLAALFELVENDLKAQEEEWDDFTDGVKEEQTLTLENATNNENTSATNQAAPFASYDQLHWNEVQNVEHVQKREGSPRTDTDLDDSWSAFGEAGPEGSLIGVDSQLSLTLSTASENEAGRDYQNTSCFEKQVSFVEFGSVPNFTNAEKLATNADDSEEWESFTGPETEASAATSMVLPAQNALAIEKAEIHNDPFSGLVVEQENIGAQSDWGDFSEPQPNLSYNETSTVKTEVDPMEMGLVNECSNGHQVTSTFTDQGSTQQSADFGVTETNTYPPHDSLAGETTEEWNAFSMPSDTAVGLQDCCEPPANAHDPFEHFGTPAVVEASFGNEVVPGQVQLLNQLSDMSHTEQILSESKQEHTQDPYIPGSTGMTMDSSHSPRDLFAGLEVEEISVPQPHTENASNFQEIGSSPDLSRSVEKEMQPFMLPSPEQQGGEDWQAFSAPCMQETAKLSSDSWQAFSELQGDREMVSAQIGSDIQENPILHENKAPRRQEEENQPISANEAEWAAFSGIQGGENQENNNTNTLGAEFSSFVQATAPSKIPGEDRDDWNPFTAALENEQQTNNAVIFSSSDESGTSIVALSEENISPVNVTSTDGMGEDEWNAFTDAQASVPQGSSAGFSGTTENTPHPEFNHMQADCVPSLEPDMKGEDVWTNFEEANLEIMSGSPRDIHMPVQAQPLAGATDCTSLLRHNFAGEHGTAVDNTANHAEDDWSAFEDADTLKFRSSNSSSEGYALERCNSAQSQEMGHSSERQRGVFDNEQPLNETNVLQNQDNSSRQSAPNDDCCVLLAALLASQRFEEAVQCLDHNEACIALELKAKAKADAVANDQFELAIKIRDEIRLLETKKASDHQRLNWQKASLEPLPTVNELAVQAHTIDSIGGAEFARRHDGTHPFLVRPPDAQCHPLTRQEIEHALQKQQKIMHSFRLFKALRNPKQQFHSNWARIVKEVEAEIINATNTFLMFVEVCTQQDITLLPNHSKFQTYLRGLGEMMKVVRRIQISAQDAFVEIWSKELEDQWVSCCDIASQLGLSMTEFGVLTLEECILNLANLNRESINKDFCCCICLQDARSNDVCCGTWEGFAYCSSCANLWLKQISTDLPAIQLKDFIVI